MDDEIWITKDGREVPVGEMSEGHVRNALRMMLRHRRRLHERCLELMAKNENLPVPDELDETFYERPDNRAVLAGLRRQHGDAVRVERSSVAGMDGGNVYVDGEWRGWMGGI